MRLLLAVHLAFTCYMAGVIWFVQIVHYPLFGEIDGSSFSRSHMFHLRRVTWVVGPSMIGELLSGVLLVWLAPWNRVYWTGLALLGLIWLSTWLLQVPKHNVLAKGFDAATHRNLVAWNWLRTAAWTARCALIVSIFA